MKKDPELGQKIKEHLIQVNAETPFGKSSYSKEEQKLVISDKFKEIMQVMNLDLSDDSLNGTPDRVAKMFVEEIFTGLDYDNFPKATTTENKMNSLSPVIEKDVKVSSTCEHHFVVIDGFAKVAYIPKEKVIGLSKINRIVDFFSRRPQIQERLTLQIFHALCLILETDNVAVEISAVHHCVKSRGIQDAHSYTITEKLGGQFLANEKIQNRFYNS